MDALPNEIILYIFMYLPYRDILCLSYVSKKFYCLCNNRLDFKELCVNVWSLYRDKKDFNLAIKKCRIDINDNIVNSFEMFKTKHYLKALLMKKLEASFENLNPVIVFIHLINCSRRIRSLQKCMLCTRFYVYSKLAMVLLKNTTGISISINCFKTLKKLKFIQIFL